MHACVTRRRWARSGRGRGETAVTTPAIMVLGTGSHVGKSLLTAALCRIFAQHGVRVAPFKSQNMSLNSAATPEGLEIGRAQALQAEAAGVPASVHMNPILMKPAGNRTSQVVVRGRIWATLSAADYYQRRVTELLPLVRESYDLLAATHNLILIEGAGSPAEINLKQNDIVNMRIAEMADARCILVGDIDRGGVFASLLGTLELLDAEERSRIGGFVINKFRGDLQLLAPGVEAIVTRVAKPCLGVVPYLSSINLEEEDSLGLPAVDDGDPWSHDRSDSAERPLRIAVIALPSISNFTDLDSLRAEPTIDLRLCRGAAAVAQADVVILPGSKQTVHDLSWMRSHGLDRAVRDYAARGLVVGICGGMQMLGRGIQDPEGVEAEGSSEGLGLLPIRTVMRRQKTTLVASGVLACRQLFDQQIAPLSVRGYEIHVGETIYDDHATHFVSLASGRRDGCVDETSRMFGTYLHGIFDDDAFRHAFVEAGRAFHRLAPASQWTQWKQLREASFDVLARHVEQSLDMRQIFRWAGLEYTSPQAPLDVTTVGVP